MDSSNNPEEVAGPSNEGTVTMVDMLNDQAELEAESDAVLGGSDDENCTYAEGYIGRQALYACFTCLPESRSLEWKRAGVCLACSLHCHDGHELVELYTKRNFRCDCGGHRMPDVTCKLDPIKRDENENNQYNQNFSGLYCTCARPYPDPEDNTPDEMIQCIVCEDWYHTRHLGNETVKESDDFAEMICGGCMERVDVLRHYVGKTSEEADQPPLDDTVQVDVTGLDDSSAANTSVASSCNEEIAEKRIKLDICTKPPLEEGDKGYKKGATFWNEGWRKQLCQCAACMETYRARKVEFLLDDKDTVQWYEKHGRARLDAQGGTVEDRQTMMWNQMGRVAQVEVLHGYNLMKERLTEFLDTFVNSQQVVTETDIKEFFARLKQERKKKASPPSHTCR